MARYIDADIVEKKIDELAKEPDYQHEGEDWVTGLFLAESIIAEVEVKDIKPIVHAHWKWDEDGVDWNIGAWVCSNCGLMFPDFDIATNKNRRVELWAHSKYCGHCGAKMDEDEKEEG